MPHDTNLSPGAEDSPPIRNRREVVSGCRVPTLPANLSSPEIWDKRRDVTSRATRSVTEWKRTKTTGMRRISAADEDEMAAVAPTRSWRHCSAELLESQQGAEDTKKPKWMVFHKGMSLHRTEGTCGSFHLGQGRGRGRLKLEELATSLLHLHKGWCGGHSVPVLFHGTSPECMVGMTEGGARARKLGATLSYEESGK